MLALVAAGQIVGFLPAESFPSMLDTMFVRASRCASLTFDVSTVSKCLAQIWSQKKGSPAKKVTEFQIFTQRESLDDPLAFFLIGENCVSSANANGCLAGRGRAVESQSGGPRFGGRKSGPPGK